MCQKQVSHAWGHSVKAHVMTHIRDQGSMSFRKCLVTICHCLSATHPQTLICSELDSKLLDVAELYFSTILHLINTIQLESNVISNFASVHGMSEYEMNMKHVFCSQNLTWPNVRWGVWILHQDS